MNPQPAPYTNQPFLYPNGITTAMGTPVARMFWEHFSQYSDAVRVLEAIKDAPLIDCTQTGQTGLGTPLKVSLLQLSIADGCLTMEDAMFVETAPLDPAKPIPENFVAPWHVQGVIMVNGVTFVVDEYVGDLVKRFTVPEGVDVDLQGTSKVLKLMLLPNVTGTLIGLAEASYRA